MKHLTAILIFIIAAMSSINAQNREPEDRNNLFSFSATRLFVNNMSYSYERLLQNSGIFLSAGVIMKDDNSEKQIGANAEFQFRLYPVLNRDKVFQGLYIAPYLNYKYLDNTYKVYEWDPVNYMDVYVNDRNEIYNILGFGVMVGTKIAIASRLVFTFELGGGLRYSDNSNNNNYYYSNNIFSPSYTGIIPRADISLGYFF